MEFRLPRGCRGRVFLYAIGIPPARDSRLFFFFFFLRWNIEVRRVDRSQLTLPVLVVLLHVASGFFDALSSAQRLPLVNAVRRHRWIVASRLVPVVLCSCPTLVRLRVPIIVILRDHRLGRGGGSGSGSRGDGGRCRWRRGFLFVLVLVVVLNEERNLDEF